MLGHSATAIRSLAGFAWKFFGWRFGRSGKGRSGKGKEERAWKWRGKENPGVEFLLEGRLLLIVLISSVFPHQMAAAEQTLKHKLHPVNTMLEIEHYDVLQAAPKEELHQML